MGESHSKYFRLKPLRGLGSQTCILGSLEVVSRFFLVGWDNWLGSP